MEKYVEIPLGIRVIGNQPLDSRSKIPTKNNLSVDYPQYTRAYGVQTLVEDENIYYHFVGGLADINFIPVSYYAEVREQLYDLECIPNGDEFTFSHGLGSILLVNMIVHDNADDDIILCDYFLGGNGVDQFENTHATLKISSYFESINIKLIYKIL